jgi:hypothetical protein
MADHPQHQFENPPSIHASQLDPEEAERLMMESDLWTEGGEEAENYICDFQNINRESVFYIL